MGFVWDKIHNFQMSQTSIQRSADMKWFFIYKVGSRYKKSEFFFFLKILILFNFYDKSAQTRNWYNKLMITGWLSWPWRISAHARFILINNFENSIKAFILHACLDKIDCVIGFNGVSIFLVSFHEKRLSSLVHCTFIFK